MPDDDRIPKTITAPWKKVLRCLRNRRPADETTDAVATALAATVRGAHGVPGLSDIALHMREVAADGAVTASHVPGSAVARRHVPTDIAELAELAYHYGLDRIGPLLAAEGIYGTRELQHLFSKILASDQISKLAKRLVARPTGEGLRAPDRQRRTRRPLEEFINTPITEL